MIRPLRGLVAALPLIFSLSAAHALDLYQLAFGIDRSATPALACALNGASCLTNWGIRIGAAQTNVNQLQTVTSDYTTGMLNTNSDILRVQVGNLPPSLEFASLDPSGVNKTTSGITCAMASPSGTSGYVGAVGWPDGCFASYVIANQTQKSAIAYLSYGGVGIDHGFVQLFNGVATNKALGPDSGTGFNADHVNGAEIDFNIYPLAGGGGMTGDIYAYQAFISTSTSAALASASAISAYRVVGVNSGKWRIGLDSIAGAASIGAQLGPILTSGASAAQPLLFVGTDGVSNYQTSVQGQADGGISVNNGRDNASLLLAHTYPGLQYVQPVAGGPVGFRVKNSSIGAGTVSANSILETGTANSNFQISLIDNGDATISTGLGQLVLSPAGAVRITTTMVFSGLTGYVKAAGAGAVTAAATIPLSDLAAQATNTIVGNATSGSAAPTALAIGTCSTAASALTWTTNTGFGCNTLVAGVANPTASVGLTAVNGTANTALRSDGAPALSQSIVPTWTGIHTFSAAPVFSLGAKYSGSSSGTVTVVASATAGTPTITWGNASGTPAVTASAPLALSTTTGNIAITGAAGQVLAGSTPAFTATPTLGVAGSTVGSLAFANGTSGSVTLQPVTGALGSAVLSLPATTSTVAVTGNNLGAFAATTSAQLAGVISDETGSGALVFATSPTLVTPTLGAATATTINGNTLTTGTGTLTLGAGKTATVSNTLTFTGTDSSSVAFGAGGTAAYTGNNLSVFASTTSAQLAGVISDETGTGALVFAAAPTLTGSVIFSGSPIINGGSFVVNQSVGAATLQIGTNFLQGAAVNAQVTFAGLNSSSAVTAFTQITSTVDTATAGAETAHFNLTSYQAGAIANRFGVGNGFFASSLTDPGSGKINAVGYSTNGSAGLGTTKTVRASGGAADCTLIFTGGILTGGSC